MEWTFDANPAETVLALEATRMQQAALFDPMLAVATSKVDPLPHQIRAVYGELLPKPGPLRFLLADDPGAGKTIMAGLYLKELLLRGDVRRCLIVAPGGLVDQWQEELAERFDLEVTILSRALADESADGNPFGDPADRTQAPLILVARMDQLSRDEAWLAHLEGSEWDLVVVDEAHRMSATYSGGELTRTLRYRLGQLLGSITRHLLLMTATPHAGKDEDFQAFLALLDPDRFEGAYRRGVHRADYSGLMRRMLKEDLLTFEGRSLFPERIATTVPYELTAAEQTLYEEVTRYVREQMNLADRVAAEGDARRRTTVGFALTVLQRRLASSPAAIHESLRRRSERLRARRTELSRLGGALEEIHHAELAVVDSTRVTRLWEDPEEVDVEETEALEEQVLDSATAARTVAELDVELAVLDELTALAAQVRASGTDRKWGQLRDLVLHAGARKLIVFTEHRDTLTYLTDRIATVLGDASAVVAIDGGTRRSERLAVRERFTHDPTCRILVATDAAGEGLNLQAAHLMVNYDLPWNPNRLEQRFGRIHRIGQREGCRLWNLVASNTREGQVFERLLTKIEEQRTAYGGKVFDVLGEQAFGERPLRELLLEAVRYGEDPAVRARLDQVIDASVAHGLADLVRERSLATPEISLADLHALRAEMDEARARRLQPHYVGRFFVHAFRAAGGSIHPRESGRFEITHIPSNLRLARVSPRYARVTFDPATERAEAEVLAPGHPLFDALVAETLRRTAHTLRRGAVLLDPDPGASARLIVAVAEELHDGEDAMVSKRHSYVAIDGDGGRLAGPAPHLDLLDPTDPAAGVDLRRLADVVAATLSQSWAARVAGSALDWSREHGLTTHRAEVQRRVARSSLHTRTLVTQRLQAQSNYWYSEAARLAEDQAAGRRVRVAPATARARAEALEERLDARLASLARQEEVLAGEPRVIGALLAVPLSAVVPVPDGEPDVPETAADTAESDRRAVAAVLAAERALGRGPEEQHHSNPGWDVLSTRPDGTTLRIEVKGRLRGAHDVHLSIQQIITGLNSGDDFVLALVEIDPDGDASRDRLRYVYRPFEGMSVHVLDSYRQLLWRPLWERGGPPR
ncbi:helicase-related protein [Miniimonas sp. S16]|uniref:helicase-related protein n=1 Tax=Miniimonas sp. S16 TaxID=2171623 RepID=UPI001901D0FD|nr:helicase-related protein [Miniimonas sp. S16]